LASSLLRRRFSFALVQPSSLEFFRHDPQIQKRKPERTNPFSDADRKL
jgi:hypothetical protein